VTNVRSYPERLTVPQARRIALAAQGFADPRPTATPTMRHVRRALGRVGIVQIDSVNVVTRAHELPLWSRLGRYNRDAIPELTYTRRELFEYWGHAASFIPVELQPLLRWRMADRESWGSMRRLQRDKPGYMETTLEEVAERGPLAASELRDGGRNERPWWGWADGKTALECLFWAGRVSAASRGPNFERRYDVTERVLPEAVLATPTPSVEDAHRALLLHAARWHGVGTARCLADYFRIPIAHARPRLQELVESGQLVPVTVDGWKPAFLHPDARRPRHIDARALIGPFDSLVWERDRAEHLFGVRVVLEVYTPAPKRVHGYYVLPFLLGDELVARVDLKADRKASVLRVQAAHTTGIAATTDHKEVAAELAEELREFAAWLGLETVTVEPRGDLAAKLTRAVRSTNRAPNASSARSVRSRRPSAPT
jgi:uncharacterized protein YcaQ